jgi:plasmid segregation protein ParM
MVHHRTTTKTVARPLRRTADATMYLGHRRRGDGGASVDVRHKCRVENARRFAGCENKGATTGLSGLAARGLLAMLSPSVNATWRAPSMEAIVRAIDVGFGNTKYVLAAQGGRVECAHFASIAYDSAHDNSNDALGSKRKTVCVPVGGMWYEVGPDVALAADGFVGRNHHDDYIRTPEYRAFTAGALHFMKVDRVDLLVLGLPVVDYMRRRAELQKAMTGKFEVGRNRTVEVKRVLVVAQPQGAMYAVFGDQANAKLRHGRTLVIDAGSRTFDWLVTLDSKVVGKMSDSVNRGVHDILLKIAAAIASETGRGYLNLEAIDRALRSRKPLRAYKRSVDLKKFDNTIEKIADQAVAMLHGKLGATDDLEHIVVVGGGMHLYRASIRRKFPEIAISEVDEPLYANVKGFQLMGEQYVRENPQLFATAPARAEVAPVGA